MFETFRCCFDKETIDQRTVYIHILWNGRRGTCILYINTCTCILYINTCTCILYINTCIHMVLSRNIYLGGSSDKGKID